MATELFDMHHACIGDIEHEFENKTGIAVAMGEGSQTNDSEKFKKQRRDCYAGKEIYVYPHVKLETKRTGISQKRRIHYCFDRDMDRIIIGWIGEHMDTAGSVHMN